ncbi:MAG TPA: cytochrome c3 family protein [Gemmatimonadales bacterium]
MVALACGAARIAAQIEPGPLAQPHQQLEGALQCVKCHRGGRDQMGARCVDCHQEIGWLLQQNRGFHAATKAQTCASCHPEHAGRDFALISWPGGDTAHFDHARAGWTLGGKHAGAACSDCHKQAFRVAPAARLSPRKGPAWGWVGLERDCVTCHRARDVHNGALGSGCGKCHDAAAWKPAPGFDHARTRYPLTGAHATVTCAECHLAPRVHPATDARGQLVAVFKPVAHAECSDCHADPHGGRMGAGCAKCHVTDAFKTLQRASFDHERTRYPLRGRHAAVACEGCHDFSAHPTGPRDRPFATCGGCHSDAHAGTATLAGAVVDCASCHTVAGWHPASYTVAQHATTRFALEGKHAQAACNECHVKNPARVAAAALGSAGVRMRPAAAGCVDCHVDPHAGRFPRCRDCHDLQGFRPATIGVREHARYRFALDGAHAAVPCVGCHTDLTHPATTSSLATVRWTAAPLAFTAPAGGCAGCHATPHGTQFAARPAGSGCETCHSTAAFRPADRFDHNRDAAFPLTGAHQGVACARCHPAARGTGGALVVRYRPVSAKCESCHSDKPRGTR